MVEKKYVYRVIECRRDYDIVDFQLNDNSEKGWRLKEIIESIEIDHVNIIMEKELTFDI